MFDVMYGAHREFLTFLMAHADAYEALGKLAETGSTLSPAAPHIPTFARWQPAVVQPKIKKLAAIKKRPRSRRTSWRGYRAVDKGLTALLGDWKTAAKKSPTPPDEVDNVRVSAEDTRKAMQAVYENLESEADAFRVEGLVKTRSVPSSRSRSRQPAAGSAEKAARARAARAGQGDPRRSTSRPGSAAHIAGTPNRVIHAQSG